jgi:hypothetical protein
VSKSLVNKGFGGRGCRSVDACWGWRRVVVT